MADFGSPVAQNVNSGNGLQTLSALIGLQSKRIGIQQQQQDLETGQAMQASAQAKATIDKQSAKENQALGQLMQDPVAGGLIDSDGNPTADGEAKVLKVAPTTGADAYGKLVTAARLRTDSMTAINNLNTQQRQEVASTIAGAAAGARSPDDIEAAVTALLAQKKGTPVYADYQKIADAAMYNIRRGGHPLADPKDVEMAGAKAPLGEEPWRQAALSVGRTVLGAQAVVGAGGIATPGATTNAAGQNLNRDPMTGALSAPPGAAPGSVINPASSTVAGSTTRQVATGNADIDTSNQVVTSQRNARANIDLTNRIDQLAEVVRPGALPAKVSQALGALGLQDVNQARTELDKDLARLKASLAERAQSDARAGPILESLPDSTKPSDTIHQAMDTTRGFAKQDLALGKLQAKVSKETGGQMSGFQGDYAHAVSAASPLMHEYLSLTPSQQVEFFKRNFATKEQAKAFRDQAESVRKRSPDVIGQ